MALIVPEGTPYPDADRRFREARWPLLEPVGWTGERYRGGFGTGTHDETTSLELVFGSRDRFTSEPRLAIGVGTRPVRDLTAPHAPLLARMALAATREEVKRRAMLPLPTRDCAMIEILGASVELNLLRRADRWLGEGHWRGYWLTLHAVRIEPADVRLQRARELPGPLHGPHRELVR